MSQFMQDEQIISIRHLSKVYPSGFAALDDINLTIKRGEIFALLGPNGAGITIIDEQHKVLVANGSHARYDQINVETVNEY